jgi:hypothetical protein
MALDQSSKPHLIDARHTDEFHAKAAAIAPSDFG